MFHIICCQKNGNLNKIPLHTFSNSQNPKHSFQQREINAHFIRCAEIGETHWGIISHQYAKMISKTLSSKYKYNVLK